MPRTPFAQIVNQLLAEKGRFSSRDLAARAGGISRQAVHRQLARMVGSGQLVVEGRGRATRYRGAAAAAYHRRYSVAGLAEDTVWQDVRGAIPALAEPGTKNARDLLAHATTELVNNAIDHSGSREVTVELVRDGQILRLVVTDEGVGAYENVRKKLRLGDALAGLQEISKGKISTAPERHSGEGIFFTSKMADRFELAANGLLWIVDNVRADQSIASAATAIGTRVQFEVALDKATTPEQVFARYTHDHQFDTTRAVVKLFEYGVRFVSRSEAKRLLAGLDRFREVIFDFAAVEGVGQGFVDEIFRVWAREHPDVCLSTENMTAAVAFMVQRGTPPA